MLHRHLNLCELIGPMAIRPSVVHMCVQSHSLSNYLTKCDGIYMTFYQLVVQMVSVAVGDTKTQIIDFEKKAMFKNTSRLEPKAFKSNHDHNVISNASFLNLRLFCHN
jgi:hypothetical protein